MLHGSTAYRKKTIHKIHKVKGLKILKVEKEKLKWYTNYNSPVALAQAAVVPIAVLVNPT